VGLTLRTGAAHREIWDCTGNANQKWNLP